MPPFDRLPLEAVILRELGMDAAQATTHVKALRPNALKLPVHTDYLAAHYPK